MSANPQDGRAFHALEIFGNFHRKRSARLRLRQPLTPNS